MASGAIWANHFLLDKCPAVNSGISKIVVFAIFKVTHFRFTTVLGVHFGLTPNTAGRFGSPRAQARFIFVASKWKTGMRMPGSIKFTHMCCFISIKPARCAQHRSNVPCWQCQITQTKRGPAVLSKWTDHGIFPHRQIQESQLAGTMQIGRSY